MLGEWRSLVARYVRGVEAAGSNPASPTKLESLIVRTHLDNLIDDQIVYAVEAFDRSAELIKDHWVAKCDFEELSINIQARFGLPCSVTDVYDLGKMWQKRIELAGRADALVHWLSPGILKEEGIEMHLYGPLREVERQLRISFPPELFSGVTIRRLRWWQMMILTQDFPPNWVDIVYFGERFLSRQISAQYKGTRLNYDDLRAHLSYAPWRGGSNEESYLEAINKGNVEPLDLRKSVFNADKASWKTMIINPASIFTEFGAEWLGECPWQLLSSALKDISVGEYRHTNWQFSDSTNPERKISLKWQLPSDPAEVIVTNHFPK